MRLGLVLGAEPAADATLAQELGFELGWIDERHAPAPLVLAGFLAARTTTLRIGASVTAGPHPVTLAEDAAVADLSLGGRLVLGVHAEDAALLAETIDLLHHALAARPFHHEGPRWRVPARMPDHDHAEASARMTPAPAQLELPIWLGGSAGPVVARSHAVPFVAASGQSADELRPQWDALAGALGPAAGRLRRPGLRSVAVRGGTVDTGALIETLKRDQHVWGLDVAILELPASLDAGERATALQAIAAEVRPQLQLGSLPEALIRYWREPAQTTPTKRSVYDPGS